MDDTKRGVLVNRMGAFVAVPITFINDERITNAGRCLYLLLSSYTSAKSDDQIAFPSYETIMKRLGWGSTQTVATALLNLMQHGWVERVRRYGTSSVYTINYAPSAGTLNIKLRKSKDHDFENQNTDTLKSADYPEVPKQEVLQQEALEQRAAADAAARAAGIANAPSQRIVKAKAKKLAAPDPFDLGELEQSPAIAAHRRICGYQPMTVEQAQHIVSRVNGTAETTWPADLLVWTQSTRRSDNQPYRLDAIEKQVQFHLDLEVRRRNGGGKKAAPMAADLYAELEKLADAPLDAIPAK